MTRRQKKLCVLSILLLVVALSISVVYKRFNPPAKLSKTTKIASVTTTELANLTMTSTKSNEGNPIYPGWVGYHGINVSALGKGISYYDLSLSITGEKNIKENILVSICKVEDSTIALATNDFTYVAATMQADTSSNRTRYYMTNGKLVLPSSCTNILNSVTLASLGNSYQISLSGGKSLDSGKNDKYYISYVYENKGQNQVQEENFTVTPIISARRGIESVESNLASLLKSKANPISNTNYNTSTAEQKKEMYTFNHPATVQTTPLTDYRYIGINPNNYVYFNCTNPANTETCEMWRILGVFPVDDGTNLYTDRVKLVREDSIGNIEFDTSGSRGSTFNNEWVGSRLALLLNNGDYYRRSNSYASTGLTTSAKSMIDTAKWYLGSPRLKDEITYDNKKGISSMQLYEEERSNTVPEGTNHNTSTTAYKVGIMYPSDYTYTYGYDVNEQCFENTYNCEINTSNRSWLHKGTEEWLLSSFESYFGSTWLMHSNNHIGYDLVYSTRSVRPVVYLSSNVEIDASVKGADGSLSHPYVLKAK